jgi:hypothetical protein
MARNSGSSTPQQDVVWDSLIEPDDDLSDWFTFASDGSIVCRSDPPKRYPLGQAIYSDKPIPGWQFKRGPGHEAILIITRPSSNQRRLRYDTKNKCWEIERTVPKRESQVPPKCWIRTTLPLAHGQEAPHAIDASHPIELHLNGMIRIGNRSFGQFRSISYEKGNLIVKKGAGFRRMLVFWYIELRDSENGPIEVPVPHAYSYERRTWYVWTERDPNFINRLESIRDQYERKGGAFTDVVFCFWDAFCRLLLSLLNLYR